jgi:hypothetical protein
MRATAIILGIVVAAAGCDKTAPPADQAPPVATVDLNARPEILFQVFGERGDARIVPIAAIVGGVPVPLELDDDGWDRFGDTYLVPGTVYPALRGGRVTGTVTVTRGMWTDGEPLYSLPGCALVLPAGSVRVDDPGAGEFTVELFASTAGLTPLAPTRDSLRTDSVTAIARRIAMAVGQQVDLDDESYALLGFRANAVHTGATPRPTIIGTFVDPSGGDEGAGRGQTAGVLAVADDLGSGYVPSYRFALNGEASGAEHRRFLDAVDLTGDGTAELLLEAWKFAGQAAPVVLSWRGTSWQETFRGRGDWCLRRAR